MHRTYADLIEDVLAAHEDLAALGEEIEDEWSYVRDLEAAWRDRLERSAAQRADTLVDEPVELAIRAAIAEIGRVRDPHRAIDWLSTFPQVVLTAMGEVP